MFCPKCGAKLLDEAMFCGKCGADLRQVDRIEPPTPLKLPDPPKPKKAQKPAPKPKPKPKPKQTKKPAPAKRSAQKKRAPKKDDFIYSKPAVVNPAVAAFYKKSRRRKRFAVTAVIVAVLIAIAVPSVLMINNHKKTQLKTANANAKIAINAMMDNLSDAANMGVPLYELLFFDYDRDKDYNVELYKTYDASDPESISEGGAKKIAQALSKLDSGAGYFIIMQSGTAGYGGERMVIQWKAEPDSKIIGQCVMDIDKEWPSYHGNEVYDEIIWDSYKKERPMWGHYY